MVVGKWPVDGTLPNPAITCTQCGTHFQLMSVQHTAICPRCKAKLDPRDGTPWAEHPINTVSFAHPHGEPIPASEPYDEAW